MLNVTLLFFQQQPSLAAVLPWCSQGIPWQPVLPVPEPHPFTSSRSQRLFSLLLSPLPFSVHGRRPHPPARVHKNLPIHHHPTQNLWRTTATTLEAWWRVLPWCSTMVLPDVRTVATKAPAAPSSPVLQWNLPLLVSRPRQPAPVTVPAYWPTSRPGTTTIGTHPIPVAGTCLSLLQRRTSPRHRYASGCLTDVCATTTPVWHSSVAVCAVGWSTAMNPWLLPSQPEPVPSAHPTLDSCLQCCPQWCHQKASCLPVTSPFPCHLSHPGPHFCPRHPTQDSCTQQGQCAGYWTTTYESRTSDFDAAGLYITQQTLAAYVLNSDTTRLSSYQWLSPRMWHLHCISNADTVVLHWAIFLCWIYET